MDDTEAFQKMIEAKNKNRTKFINQAQEIDNKFTSISGAFPSSRSAYPQ